MVEIKVVESGHGNLAWLSKPDCRDFAASRQKNRKPRCRAATPDPFQPYQGLAAGDGTSSVLVFVGVGQPHHQVFVRINKTKRSGALDESSLRGLRVQHKRSDAEKCFRSWDVNLIRSCYVISRWSILA